MNRGATIFSAVRKGSDLIFTYAMCRMLQRLAIPVVLLAIAASAAGVDQCMQATPCSFTCKLACNATQPTHGQAQSVRIGRLLQNTSAGTDPEAMNDLITRVTAVAGNKFFTTTQQLQAGQYPVATKSDGSWETVSAGHWMSGFISGVCWQLYELTGGLPMWANMAQRWQKGLANKQREFASQHDFGFIYLPSFAHSYSVSKSTEDLRQALAAAEALSWSYVPSTKSLRTFEGWKTPHSTRKAQQIVIIDFMINIQMLVWGSQHVGPAQDLRMDLNPQDTWLNMAMDHARQVAANHVRPDGTTYHIVEYNPITGNINAKYTYQGYSANSTWSRGQAWAITGFAMLYNATGNTEFLDTARKLTDKYLDLLAKQPAGLNVDLANGYDGWVPQWDFSAPYHRQLARYPNLDGPRDTSAAAVVALGLLYLAESEPDASCGQRYLCAAVNTIRALASPKYLAGQGEQFPALLKHATGGFPMMNHVDVGLISGDYFYLTALQKCMTMQACRDYGS